MRSLKTYLLRVYSILSIVLGISIEQDKVPALMQLTILQGGQADQMDLQCHVAVRAMK